jgi:hypothetical protein
MSDPRIQLFATAADANPRKIGDLCVQEIAKAAGAGQQWALDIIAKITK